MREREEGGNCEEGGERDGDEEGQVDGCTNNQMTSRNLQLFYRFAAPEVVDRTVPQVDLIGARKQGRVSRGRDLHTEKNKIFSIPT